MKKDEKIIFTEQFSEHVEIEGKIYYSKGGVNIWSGNSDPRGYWFSQCSLCR